MRVKEYHDSSCMAQVQVAAHDNVSAGDSEKCGIATATSAQYGQQCNGV